MGTLLIGQKGHRVLHEYGCRAFLVEDGHWKHASVSSACALNTMMMLVALCLHCKHVCSTLPTTVRRRHVSNATSQHLGIGHTDY
jgi:hypothetical protein